MYQAMGLKTSRGRKRLDRRAYNRGMWRFACTYCDRSRFLRSSAEPPKCGCNVVMKKLSWDESAGQFVGDTEVGGSMKREEVDGIPSPGQSLINIREFANMVNVSFIEAFELLTAAGVMIQKQNDSFTCDQLVGALERSGEANVKAAEEPVCPDPPPPPKTRTISEDGSPSHNSLKGLGDGS